MLRLAEPRLLATRRRKKRGHRGAGPPVGKDPMNLKKLTAGAAGLLLALSVMGGAAAAKVPSKVTIKSKTSASFKPNRYLQDGLRWNRDVYVVRSGGTLHVVNGDGSEGPHTFSVLRRRDIPKTIKTLFNCKACNALIQAHGADPSTEAPPKFPFLENGVGQMTPPNVDRPGDSGLIGTGKKGDFVNFKVTAKPGTTLYFMCLIHPWMQAKVVVKR
jgi:hypothetical protein